MINVKIEHRELTRLLRDMKRKQKTLKPLFVLFYGKIDFDVKQNFRLQGSTGDIFTSVPTNTRKRWKALSSLSSAHRSAQGSVGGVLQASGLLYASTGKVKEITDKHVVYGTHSKTAAIHHFGGTIRPKRTQYLAIPYPGITGRPRQYTDTFFAKRTMFQSLGGGEYRPLFMLKEKVDMPARPFMTIKKSTIDSFGKMALGYLTGEAKL